VGKSKLCLQTLFQSPGEFAKGPRRRRKLENFFANFADFLGVLGG